MFILFNLIKRGWVLYGWAKNKLYSWSCKFNDGNNNKCILKQITVTPVDDVETELPDESMCSSYENYNM